LRLNPAPFFDKKAPDALSRIQKSTYCYYISLDPEFYLVLFSNGLSMTFGSESAMAVQSFILFAEDNGAEAELIRHACERAGLGEESYCIVPDGLQAISYLQRSGR
jgi:hypothetical protein